MFVWLKLQSSAPLQTYMPFIPFNFLFHFAWIIIDFLWSGFNLFLYNSFLNMMIISFVYRVFNLKGSLKLRGWFRGISQYDWLNLKINLFLMKLFIFISHHHLLLVFLVVHQAHWLIYSRSSEIIAYLDLKYKGQSIPNRFIDFTCKDPCLVDHLD